MNIKDFNLLEWMGANSFRTTHYPYSEEILQLADERGMVVIGEVPAVGLNPGTKMNHGSPQINYIVDLPHHLDCIKRMIARDKNHPSIVMWSLANEASTYEPECVDYFTQCHDLARGLDDRPLTIVQSSYPDVCKVQQLFDVVCLNRYYGWYENTADLDLRITRMLSPRN